MTKTRTSATAAATLVVAAVVAVSSAWALASQPSPSLTDTPPAAATNGARADQPDALDRADRRVQPTRSPEGETPTRLRITSIDVDAPVVPTGVTANGDAEIPPDGDVVGWYEFGSAPGDAKGSTVLIGHRDTNAEGPGALFDLDEVFVGDDITVASGGRGLEYRVTSVRSIPKAGLPSSLFRRGGPPQLVVITCGGAYLPDAGGYQENLFAVATPTP